MVNPEASGRVLRLEFADIDGSLLPTEARAAGSSAFNEAVFRLVRRLLHPLGGRIESLAMAPGALVVTWIPGDAGIGPVVEMLERGEGKEAIFVLELLRSDQPDDAALLYNLGMAYSDVGRLDRAVSLLRRLLVVQPGHVNGRVALGTALVRQQDYEEARLELQRAVDDDPANPWAHCNLGACLLTLERAEEAVVHLRKATELKPTFERAWCGLGQALERAGDTAGADEAYQRTLAIAAVGDVAEVAREARSRIAAETFRQAMPGMPRTDAVMYCLGALERFERMTPDEVKRIGFEIAVLGMNGLDVNDPTPKYRLRSLPGEFSGLHLVSLQYVAFKSTAPETDIGFDLAREYEVAQSLHGARGAARE